MRTTVSKDNWNPLVYPLVERKINRKQCDEIIAAEGLPLPVKSGCTFCMYQPISEWRKLYVNHNDLYWQAVKMEENDRNKHALISVKHAQNVFICVNLRKCLRAKQKTET